MDDTHMKEIIVPPDRVDFNEEEFDKETENKIKDKNKNLEELKQYADAHRAQKNDIKVIRKDYFKSFKNKLTHLNEQMIFLKIGAILIVIGFSLQFISAFFEIK